MTSSEPERTSARAVGHERRRTFEEWCPGADGGTRWEPRRHRIDGSRQHLDEPTSAVDVDEGLAPSGVEHGEPERQVVEHFVGDDDAIEQLRRKVDTGFDPVRMTLALHR